MSGITAASANGAQPLVRVDGFVAPFGSAPPNFNASAVTLGTATTDQQLIIEWINSSLAPFTSLTATSVVPNLTLPDLTGIHEIRTGPVSQDITQLPAGFTIVPMAIGANTMLLSAGDVENAVASFNSAQPWVTAINTAIGKGIGLTKLVATGYYDSTANTFYAYNISINE